MDPKLPSSIRKGQYGNGGRDIQGTSRGTIGEPPKYSLPSMRKNRGMTAAASASRGRSAGTSLDKNRVNVQRQSSYQSPNTSTVSAARGVSRAPAIPQSNVSTFQRSSMMSNVRPSNSMKPTPFQKVEQNRVSLEPLEGNYFNDPFVEPTPMAVTSPGFFQPINSPTGKKTKGKNSSQPTANTGAPSLETMKRSNQPPTVTSAATAASSRGGGDFGRQAVASQRSGVQPFDAQDVNQYGTDPAQELVEETELPVDPKAEKAAAKQAQKEAKEAQKAAEKAAKQAYKDQLKEQQKAREDARKEEEEKAAAEAAAATAAAAAEAQQYEGYGEYDQTYYDEAGYYNDAAYGATAGAGAGFGVEEVQSKAAQKEMDAMNKNLKKLEKIQMKEAKKRQKAEKKQLKNIDNIYKNNGGWCLKFLLILLLLAILAGLLRCYIVQFTSTAAFMSQNSWLHCDTCTYFTTDSTCNDECTVNPNSSACNQDIECVAVGDPDKKVCTCTHEDLVNTDECQESVECTGLGVPDATICTCDNEQLIGTEDCPNDIECTGIGVPDEEECTCVKHYTTIEDCWCTSFGVPDHCDCSFYPWDLSCCTGKLDPTDLCTCYAFDYGLDGCDRPISIETDNWGLFFGTEGPSDAFDRAAYQALYDAGMTHFWFTIHGTYGRVDVTELIPIYETLIDIGVQQTAMISFLNHSYAGATDGWNAGTWIARAAISNTQDFIGGTSLTAAPIYAFAGIIICEFGNDGTEYWCLNYKGQTSKSTTGDTNSISTNADDQYYNCQMLKGFLYTVVTEYTSGPSEEYRASVFFGNNSDLIFGASCDISEYLSQVIYYNKNHECLSDCGSTCSNLLNNIGTDIDVTGRYIGINRINDIIPSLPSQSPFTLNGNFLKYYDADECDELD